MSKAVSTISPADIDFDQIRSDFPVLQEEVRGKPLVYLDNAASSQMPTPVADRIDHYHRHEHANVHRGIHHLSQKATDAYEATRKKIRSFINAEHLHEVIYTTGTTDGINLVAHSFGEQFLSEGDEIIVSEIEHHANIVPWQIAAQKHGANVRVIPVNDAGELIWDEFLKLINERTAIIAVAQVSNALGTVHPVKRIIREAHKHDIPVLVDGAQGVPHSLVDVQDLDADFYAFSSHKMCGPTGFGILYGKEKYLEKMPPYRSGGDMIDKVAFEGTTFNDLPHKFEAGTPPIVAGIGLGAAVDYLTDIGMENIAAHEQQLLDYATEQLLSIDGLRIIGTAQEKASVISFVFDDIHATDIGTILDQQGIAIRTGHHCAQPAMRRYNIPGTARASLSFYNNKQDINRLVEGVKEAKGFF
ncbi:aminotransferase class V-fold PLP-dependent enzyme [Fodinibius salsisoli]|uniref:Probable cysteine desulfurase n=1 Tax=Fodinibius salsisoli TaxID=2820877 RepID=A0ABT3PK53_9BACT|nr:cysteine desulfurase [Fodinibius salsisoli]MCW9706325.1 cysteine desulfurase [Fodinibius salsisoli]